MRWRWFPLLFVTVLVATVAACAGDDASPAPAHTANPQLTPEPTRVRSVNPGTGTRRRPPAMPALRTAGCTAAPHDKGTVIETIETSDGNRSYRLHVPPGYAGKRPTPLVLNFHGYAQNAEQQEAYSGLVPISDAKGFILVTPEGSSDPEGWDIVGVYAETGVDDLAYVGALVAHLSDTLCLDSKRVFATGHSNGAEMAAQLACFEPGLVAAVAPVSGAVYQGCDGAPTPIISFQGTDDWNVPYEDSADAMTQWAEHDGCTGDPASSATSDHVTEETWQGCSAAVEFYVIDGGGHTWPGADATLGGVGETTDEINASQLIWAFFAAHPHP